MGEIGIPRREYLYELTYCEMLLIERGYAARSRQMWSATRWQTYHNMLAFVGSEGMGKAGITEPSKLLPFPWDKNRPVITPSEVEELQSQMDAMKDALRKSKVNPK